jgi:hypothetical protein
MVSEERIRYLIENVGADVTAKAFSNLARTIESSSNAAKQHANDLKAAARTNEVMERSAQRQAAAQKLLADAAKAQADAARAQMFAHQGLAQTATAAANATSNLTNKAKGSAIVLGQFANAATGMIPQLNGAGAAIVRASSVIGGIASSAGAGPAGLIAGGAVAALGLLSLAFKSNKETADEAKAALAEYVEELKAVNEAAAEAAANSPLGVARRAEQERRRENLERQRNTMVGLFDPASGASPVGYGTGYDLGKDDKGRTFASKEEQREFIKGKEEDAGGDKKKRSGKAPALLNQTRGDLLTEADSMSAELQQQADRAKAARERAERLAGVGDKQNRGIDAGASAADAIRSREDALFNKQMADVRALTETKLSAHEQEMRALDEREARTEAFHATVRDGAQETWMMAGGAAANAFAAMARGEKVSMKAILASLGSQAIAAGTMKLFEAAFAAFTLNPAAAGMAAVGTAQIAFGAALSGAGAGGGPSTGGGGGGSLPGGRPVSPTFVPGSEDTGAKNPQPTVVHNHYHPAVVSPSAQDGRRSQEALDEMRRQGRAP